MSAELYQMISMIAFICGGVLTVVAIILFVKFDIPALIGELSGKTAEKKVQEIREQNRQAVSMRQRNSERKRKISLYDPKTKNTAKEVQITKAVLDEGTEVLYEQTAVLDETTEVLYEQTTLLNDNHQEVGTTLLNESYHIEEQTTLLSENIADEGTTILGEDSVSADADFCMLEDVVEVHTDETI